MGKIAFPVAVFTITVSIDLKLLSAVLTSQSIVSLLGNAILMLVPPCHTALIGAEFLLLSPLALFNGLSAVHTYPFTRSIRITPQERFNGVTGQAKDTGNRARTAAFTMHILNGIFLLKSHMYSFLKWEGTPQEPPSRID